jgi:integrase/recombinase XerC
MHSIQPAQSSSFFFVHDRDILKELLADKRSPNTRRAYEGDLKDFFQIVCRQEPSPQLIREFLNLERFTAIALVLQYKAHLIDKGLAEATINRRLAAIKSLVSFAQKIGKCIWSLEEIQGEKIQSYRDTSGVSQDVYKTILETCDRDSLKGKRDYALLRLLWDNALRRNEISMCDREDFDPTSKTLSILGKGRGTQKESVTLSDRSVEALKDWLASRDDDKKALDDKALFVALDRAHAGHRLTGGGIYNLVSESAKKAGVTKQFSPHRCRHSSITAALDATNGNVREVQKLSRHKKVEVLIFYDDQRINSQGRVTDLLSDLV